MKKKEVEKKSIFHFTPIGYFTSVFKQKTGCPRQAGLIPEAKGVLRLTVKPTPYDFCDGLDQFSHIWVIFVFHQNYHLQSTQSEFLRAKVRPPRLEGKKVGVFSTRSPYRPNSIGQSVVKLEKIEETSSGECFLHVSGCDLVSGTPVLDVKPYIPQYDAISSAKTPDWIKLSNFKDDVVIVFTPECLDELKLLLEFQEYYKTEKELVDVVKKMILLEPRSKYRIDNFQNEVFAFFVDNINVRCLYVNPKECHVIQFEKMDNVMKMDKKELKDRNKKDGIEYLLKLEKKKKEVQKDKDKS